MSRRPLRIATTGQWERSVRAAGFEAHLIPAEVSLDFHRTLAARMEHGPIVRAFLEQHDIDLMLDFNTGAMTFVPSSATPGQFALASADAGVPYVAFYLDPITSTMNQVDWADHWHLIESPTWIKAISDTAHAEELLRLGASNVLYTPMAGADEPVDTSFAPAPDPGPVVAFMGHPASNWFRSSQAVLPGQLFPGMLAAAVRADTPDMPFHRMYFDLYDRDKPAAPGEDRATRTARSHRYFNEKFVYNAFLAVRQRDRWAHFLKGKLGDNFELIGDHWGETWGLKHTPRIWDMKELHRRMRHVPICLNLIKGNIESSVIIRHFEITAHGGFMLTYPTPELSQFFEIGKECVVFHDEADLLDKIAYYLAHPQERYEIAAAGQRRTLRDHLFSHRLTALVERLRADGVLPRLAGGPAAPALASAGAASP
jgi:hypothetical protein